MRAFSGDPVVHRQGSEEREQDQYLDLSERTILLTRQLAGLLLLDRLRSVLVAGFYADSMARQ